MKEYRVWEKDNQEEEDAITVFQRTPEYAAILGMESINSESGCEYSEALRGGGVTLFVREGDGPVLKFTMTAELRLDIQAKESQ